MFYNQTTKTYVMSPQDSLINSDKIIEITPRPLDDVTNTMFNDKLACHVIMENNDMFYVDGSFHDISMKIRNTQLR